MEKSLVNDYKIARVTAGMTQERWAEKLGVSVESVHLYETGRGLPSDEVVQTMIELSMMPVLGYWHMSRKSRLAAELLPEVPEVDLPQAVVKLLGAMRCFEISHRVDELLKIAADGVVSGGELPIFQEILEDLEEIVEGAMAVKFARANENAPAAAGGNHRGGVMVKTMRTDIK